MNYKLLILMQFIILGVFAQEVKVQLDWDRQLTRKVGNKVISFPGFEGVTYENSNQNLPIKTIRLKGHIEEVVLSEIQSQSFQGNIPKPWQSLKQEKFKVSYHHTYYKKSPFTIVTINPIRLNNGRIDKLTSFSLKFVQTKDVSSFNQERLSSVASSPLATGKWGKLGLTRDGVYKITPGLLQSLGLGSNLSIDKLQIFASPTVLVSEKIESSKINGLEEIAVYQFDNGDGIFNGNDYILFFYEGPHPIRYFSSSGMFRHDQNPYREKNFVFVTIGINNGKRIVSKPQISQTPILNFSTTDEVKFIENDEVNLVGTGKRWFGDLFDFTLSRDYEFDFTDVDFTKPGKVYLNCVGRTFSSGPRMVVSYQGNQVLSSGFTSTNNQSGAPFATDNLSSIGLFSPTSNKVTLNLTFNNSLSPSGTAWLDKIDVQIQRKLEVENTPYIIRRSEMATTNGVYQFNLTDNSSNGFQIWDVTDLMNPTKVEVVGSSQVYFRDQIDTIQTYVAVPLMGDYLTPTSEGPVVNQNLSGLKNVDYIIVSPNAFLSEANRLANFHESYSDLTVEVVTPQQVFNEFSGGGQDPVAIRELMRSLYVQAQDSTELPRFLLQFGDASYDYKNVITPNHNFVPIWSTWSSMNLLSSFASDDILGMLDVNEGDPANLAKDIVDIGVGRIPCDNLREARTAVDKVINYTSNPTYRGNWQNKVLWVSDDVDAGWERAFTTELEKLDNSAKSTKKQLNTLKVYADAYPQISLAGSQRYPDAREDIFRKVEKGVVFTSYIGHGGEVGWASERILQLAEVNGWTNKEALSVFSTITCEFSRFDDPLRQSAGEKLLFNPNGGAIGLFSTTRSVYATNDNYNINRDIFNFLFKRNGPEYKTFGEVLADVKNDQVNNGDRRVFALLGDPAVRLAIPVHFVKTDAINGIPLGQFNDTLKALDKVTVNGHVADFNQVLIPDYNGVVSVEIYDKATQTQTLVNDGVGNPVSFEKQENVLYRGKVNVVNGQFSYTFVVPRDIDYRIDFAKFSYFSTDGAIDGTGYLDTIKLGGVNSNALDDKIGPALKVFINDESFVNGGLTNPDPVLLIQAIDSSGINTLGTGIGHDIVAVMDGNVSEPIVLNDYYEADLNSYQSGEVRYPFFDLDPGEHHLKVRVWDVYNNPSEAEIEFLVANDAGVALDHVLNWPNPFTTYTEFHFEHNRPGEVLDVQVQVFSVSGSLVKTINQSVATTGNRVNSIKWDGLDDYGEKIGKGVYVYRLTVRSQSDEEKAQKTEKLVILR